MKLHFGAALAALALLGGCATITRGTTEAFVVETDPAGAQVTTTLGHSCKSTPCTFAKVPRESEFAVTISKAGYQTTTHQITHQTAGGGGAAMAGNVIVGGLIGAAIDGNNGATQDLVPNPLVVKLQPEEAAPVVAPVKPSAPTEAEVPAADEAGAAQ